MLAMCAAVCALMARCSSDMQSCRRMCYLQVRCDYVVQHVASLKRCHAVIGDVQEEFWFSPNAVDQHGQVDYAVGGGASA